MPRCIILLPRYAGIQPHWGLFCRYFKVLPQLGGKIAGSLWIKVAYKSCFFHISLPSNVVNWAKKMLYVYDCNALAFSHQFPSRYQ